MTSALIVGNGKVLTRDAENPWVDDGAVACLDGKIAAVGATGHIRRKFPGGEFIDARGGLIMPGLINAHQHTYSAFARGLSIPGNNPSNFLEILEGTWWRIDRKLTLDQTYYGALSFFLESIRCGVTTVIDHHAGYGAISGSLSRIEEAARLVGSRACLCYEVSDRDGPEKALEAIGENADFIARTRANDDDRIGAMMGLHASFTLSDATLASCRDAAGDAGFHVHVAEGASDAAHCRSTYGVSVVERLERAGILGKKTIAAHCIHIDESDIDRLAAADTCVVHNPESNMANAVGCPPVLVMVKAGVLVGLGTDGYTNDMLESLKAANCLLKHDSRNPSAAWGEVPASLFANNREIFRRTMGVNAGILATGACADISVFDYHPYTPMDGTNADGHILFGLSGRQAVDVVVSGRVVLRDGMFTEIDEREIAAKSREAARALWKAVRE